MKRLESTGNALVKHWKKLITVRKERDKTNEFVVEGMHLVEEAIRVPGMVKHIMLSDYASIPHTWNIDGIEVLEISPEIVEELTDTEHTQGIFAHCALPQMKVNSAEWRRVLLIDAVQDPGNVGTMIRTADAAGVDAVILGKGSADAYNPKTLRSAQGSTFHLPVLKGDLSEWVNQLADHHFAILGTSLQGASNYRDVSMTEKMAFIMGNEGSGVQPQLLEQVDAKVKIPIYGKAESLNVAMATGILLYHFAEKA
ncbi:TrmH family RNA methyltransferase [Chryseomicrobium palamuruense]|uniref:TrmH family RNA methyltransferase n=1 Tax=Chryseomicrobium palamuruense TaxID=682973 RepID=A0ABV8UXA8_9BACL